MIDIKKLLRLLTYLHDGEAEIDWDNPVGPGMIRTDLFFRRRQTMYKLD